MANDFNFGQLEPDYHAPFQAWKTAATPQTSGALLRAVDPVLKTALRSYGGGSSGSRTLQGRAKQMALGAFQSYDPQRGTLKTHLLSQLQGLRRHAAREQNVISIPEQVGLDYQRLLDSENELRDQLGRDPSDAEISDLTGLSGRRLAHIRRSKLAIAEGSLGIEGDLMPAVTPLHGDSGERAWQDFIYADLGPVDRVIFDYSLGRNDTPQLSVQEIAQRLGITPSAVSQRTAKMQKLLDERHALGIL